MYRRRSKFGTALRRSRKLLTIWILLVLLAAYQWIRTYCASNPEGTCEDLFERLLDSLVVVGVFSGLALVSFLIWVIRKARQRRAEAEIPGFKNQPWKHDDRIVKLYGKVEKAFKPSLEERFARYRTNLIRTLTKDDDPAGRYLHQKFLISSPQLKKKELLLVQHNTNFGAVSVKAGNWIEIQGEYMHRRSRKRSTFGKKLTYYGFVHLTHTPVGYIKVLASKPKEIGEVVVSDRRRRRDED